MNAPNAAPATTSYSPPCSWASEAPAPYPIQLDEATLAALWAGQRFPDSALSLPNGQRLRVVHPGRRSSPGPDFRDAVIIAGGRSWYGDVEIHLSANDWWAHGHARDPAYDRVILHVVFREPEPDGPLARTASGRAAPTIALERWLSWRAGELDSRLQHPDRWRSPCTDAAERVGKAESRALLQKLTLTRLRERIPSPLSSPEDHLYVSLLASAAAPHDRALYRSIALSLPWEQLRRQMLSLGQAARACAAQTALMERLRAHDLRPQAHLSMRPNARPERRLAGIAQLLARYSASGLFDPLSRASARSTPALLVALSVGPSEQEDSALIGRGGAIELATNAVIPVLLAYALRSGSHEAERLLVDRYLSLPRPAHYGRTTELEKAITGASPLPLPGAAGQQALLHLQKHFCATGMCGRCPFSPGDQSGNDTREGMASRSREERTPAR